MIVLYHDRLCPLKRHIPHCQYPSASFRTGSRPPAGSPAPLRMGGHGKGQAHVHAAGVAFDRRIQELLYLGEGHDLVELAVDLSAFHAQACAERSRSISGRAFTSASRTVSGRWCGWPMWWSLETLRLTTLRQAQCRLLGRRSGQGFSTRMAMSDISSFFLPRIRRIRRIIFVLFP